MLNFYCLRIICCWLSKLVLIPCKMNQLNTETWENLQFVTVYCCMWTMTKGPKSEHHFNIFWAQEKNWVPCFSPVPVVWWDGSYMQQYFIMWNTYDKYILVESQTGICWLAWALATVPNWSLSILQHDYKAWAKQWRWMAGYSSFL